MFATAKVLLLGAVGITLGLFCAYLGLMLGGAGHGWLAGFWFGLLAPPGACAAFVALALSPDRGHGLATATVAVSVLLDIPVLMVALTDSSIARVREGALMWFAAWFAWQAVAMLAWWRCERYGDPPPDDGLRALRK